MSNKNLTPVQKDKKQKKEKPWITCTWYPNECNAVGCDCGQSKCIDYKDDWEE